MRNAVAPLLAAVLVAVIASVVWIAFKDDSDRGAAGESARLVEDLGDLARRLEEQEARYDEQIRILQEKITILERERADGVVALGPAGGSGEDAPDEAGDATPNAESERSLEGMIAGLDAGQTKQLREFVTATIQQERDDRSQANRSRWQQRQKEFKEFQKGPYGKFNYKVNSMASKLGLSENQKQFYYETLTDFDTRQTELRKNVKWKDAESRRLFGEERKGMQEEFDSTVAQAFTQEQREIYNETPEWERRPDGSSHMVFSSASGDAPFGLDISESITEFGSGAIQIRTAVDGIVENKTSQPAEGEK